MPFAPSSGIVPTPTNDFSVDFSVYDSPMSKVSLGMKRDNSWSVLTLPTLRRSEALRSLRAKYMFLFGIGDVQIE